MPTPLVIKEYDPQWPVLFEELRVKLSELLGNMVSAIEHVGSTSVPGLAAKPIIDLDVLLASADYFPEAIGRLAALGYEHQGDLGITGREAFSIPPTFLHIISTSVSQTLKSSAVTFYCATISHLIPPRYLLTVV
jgi:GrpB-like predicted nucleotidyltransferase (UPF0157 family)